MTDQPETQQPEPSNSATNVSGGVNANAERIDIGGDMVARDKIEASTTITNITTSERVVAPMAVLGLIIVALVAIIILAFVLLQDKGMQSLPAGIAISPRPATQSSPTEAPTSYLAPGALPQSIHTVAPTPTPTHVTIATAPVSITNQPQQTSTPTSSKVLQMNQIAILDIDNTRQIVWSPDRKWLAISGYNVQFYDAKTLKQVYVLDGLQWVSNSAFSPDSSKFATAAYEGVKLWAVKGWGELRTLAASENTSSISFSPDGKLLVTGTGGTVKLWDVDSGEELITIPAGGYGKVDAVAFSPDGKVFAAGGGGEIKVWNVTDFSEVSKFEAASSVNGLVFSPDGRTLAVAATNGTMVQLHDVYSGRQVSVLSGHDVQIASVAFSPDGTILAAGSGVSFKLWDLATETELLTVTRHSRGVSSLAFSPDGTILASGAENVRLWQLVWTESPAKPTPTLAIDGSHVTPIPTSARSISPGNIGQLKQIGMLKSGANQIAWSPDGKWLAICDYYIYLYDAKTLKQVYEIDSSQWPKSIAFSLDSTMLAIAASEGVQLWAVMGRSELRSLSNSQDSESVAFAPNGKMLATGTGSTTKLWDVASGNELLTLPTGTVKALAFSPDGHLLAAAINDDLTLWELPSVNVYHTFNGHSNQINSIVFSPDGKSIATGSIDATVRLWGIAERRQLEVFTGHSGQIDSVAFSPDGRLLASASWDLTVKLWEAATGRELRTLTGHTGWVSTVAFSPDGATLASASGASDQTIRLWGVQP